MKVKCKLKVEAYSSTVLGVCIRYKRENKDIFYKGVDISTYDIWDDSEQNDYIFNSLNRGKYVLKAVSDMSLDNLKLLCEKVIKNDIALRDKIKSNDEDVSDMINKVNNTKFEIEIK